MKITVTNEHGTGTADVEFQITHRDNAVSVGVERIDIRRDKKYGLKLTVGAKIETKDWPLCQRLCAGTTNNVRHYNVEKDAPKFVASNYAPSIGISVTLPAESPKKILDSSAPEAKKAIADMVRILEECFKSAVAEHEARVAAEVDADTATRIARWAASQIAKQAEVSVNYEERFKALEEERKAALEKLATEDQEAFIRGAVNRKDSIAATERAIRTALTHLPEFLKPHFSKAGSEERIFFGTGKELRPEDLVNK